MSKQLHSLQDQLGRNELRQTIGSLRETARSLQQENAVMRGALLEISLSRDLALSTSVADRALLVVEGVHG